MKENGFTQKWSTYNGWLNHKYYLENGRMETECMVPAEHVQGASTYVGVDGNIQSAGLEAVIHIGIMQKRYKVR